MNRDTAAPRTQTTTGRVRTGWLRSRTRGAHGPGQARSGRTGAATTGAPSAGTHTAGTHTAGTRLPEGPPEPRSDGAGPADAGGGAAADERAPGRRRFDGRRRWIAAAIVVALLSPVAWSYGGALAAPGNNSLSVRSVEWVRDHHGRSLVNAIENFWYNHHKPKKGGVPRTSLAGPAPAAGGAPAAPAAGQAAQGPAAPAVVDHLSAPAAIAPIVSPPLAGEGQWHPLGTPVNGVPAMYSALVRPDPVYTSVVTGVAWMDPTLVKAVLYAGVQEPGGSGWHYQAPVAPADRSDLLAAFNSGFKLKDSQGGYYAEGRMIRALRAGAATLAIRSDGTPTVGEWGRDIQMGPDIAFARQNLALIVDGGQPVPDISSGNAKWGATLGNKVLVWRSGVGVTANGALVYAGGNDLSAASLARVLARAGAVRAMELDINSAWVDFFTYGPPAAGQPPADLTVTKLLPNMGSSLNRYLSANSRDFIAIFRR